MAVHAGAGGYEDFTQAIREIFRIPAEHLELHLAFDCADPVSGALPSSGSGKVA